jgi:hypothetical protein
MSDNEMTYEVDIGEEDNVLKSTRAVTKKPYEATPKDASFFFSVLKNCRSKPDVRQIHLSHNHVLFTDNGSQSDFYVAARPMFKVVILVFIIVPAAVTFQN